MADYKKIASIRLRSFLLLLALVFAGSATFLSILLSAAATETGSGPATAITLTEGENTGVLGPAGQRWFRIVPDPQPHSPNSGRSLTLIFSSELEDPNQSVTMPIYDEAQIPFFGPDGADQMAPFGTGHLVVDQESGTRKLVWSGMVDQTKPYYVQILNSSELLLEYWLINEVAVVKPPEITVEAAIPEPEPVLAPVPVPVVVPGTSPESAATLNSGVNQGQLEPHITRWYTFIQNDPANPDHFQDSNFSLFFTPGNGSHQNQVNFELFTASEMEAWGRGERSQPTNFGAGRDVSRDGDPNTAERVWGGTLLRGDTYYVAIQNESDFQLDYWLFDDDVYDPQLGQPADPEPAATPEFLVGAASQEAIPLTTGQNTGGLEPGQDRWYSFTARDGDGDFFAEHTLTMFATPGDGNRIQFVNFEVFTAEGVRRWSSAGGIGYNVGAGSVVVRDNNPLTGERLWTGWLIEGTPFYVRVSNGSDTHIDYWLFPADEHGPELN